MSSVSALTTVTTFSSLPHAEEKAAIEKQYLADEVSTLEFLSLATAYIKKVREANSK